MHISRRLAKRQAAPTLQPASRIRVPILLIYRLHILHKSIFGCVTKPLSFLTFCLYYIACQRGDLTAGVDLPMFRPHLTGGFRPSIALSASKSLEFHESRHC